MKNTAAAFLKNPHLRRLAREGSGFFLRPVQVFKDCKRSDIRPDMIAGLTVAVVMLPQAIAYAMIAELPPQMGLFAAIVASIVGALWGSSKHLHTGPTNAASLLVLATLITVAEPGTPEFIAAAGYMAIMVGLIRLVMGLLRMGVLVNFVADSVVIGFTAGAGVLICFNQLRHLLRVDFPSSPELLITIRRLAENVDQTHLPSLFLGLGTMAVIILIKKIRPSWPSALIAMILASMATAFLDLDQQGVKVLGALPRGLPPIAPLPGLSAEMIQKLSAGAFAVAAIGLAEAVSIARTIASQSGQRLDSNQEFVGQGLANIAAGFFSGYTVSGSFIRSAVNHSAGAKSPLAVVYSAFWVLLAMLLLAPLAVYLPRTSLAGVLLVAAFGMISRAKIKQILRSSRGDSSVMIATALATLFLHLEFAVLAGMLVSFARYLIKTSSPDVYPVVPDKKFLHFVKARNFPVCPQLGIIEIEGSLYFGAVHHIEDEIRDMQEKNPSQIFLLLRMHMVDHCDVSGIHMLEGVTKSYQKRGGNVFLDGIRPGVLHMIGLYGYSNALGSENIVQPEDTISHLFHKVLHPGYCVYECCERIFSECQALPKNHKTSSLPTMEGMANQKIEELDPADICVLLEDPDIDVKIIDVDEKGEYQNWHIKEAISMPLRLLPTIGPELYPDSTIVFISRGGRRSALATHIMLDIGHKSVFNLKGGMLSWEASDMPFASE